MAPSNTDVNKNRYIAYTRYRDTWGMTDYRVAKICNVPRSTMSDWKAGRVTPRVNTLIRIANYFGVTVNDLVGE